MTHLLGAPASLRLRCTLAACFLWAMWQDRTAYRHAGQIDHGA